MLKLIRSGHKTLILETADINSAIQFLNDNVNVVSVYNPVPRTSNELHESLGTTTDKNVVAYLTKSLKPQMSFEELDAMLLVEGEMFEILIQIINMDSLRLFTRTRVGPGLVIMKLIGDEDQVIEMVRNDFNATSASILTQLNEHSTGTVIAFAKGDISKPVSIETAHPTTLHTEMDFRNVISAMRLQNLKYLNTGLHNEDWYELKIKIYDAYGHFDLHYKRLAYILEKLDLGLILGESWGTDAATIFLSVGIYKVRFFTFYNPIHIKKILLGLEFLDDETRVVDYDLYYKRRKIHWDALRDKTHASRESLSHVYRQEILDHLTEDEYNELLSMEQEILDSRKTPFK